MVYSTRKIDNDFVLEKKIYIDGIPCLRFLPVNRKNTYPTIIYYHGWSSSKEFQRFKANILALYGYQVIVPDSIHHGERSPVYYTEEGIMEKYLLKVIYNSIKEAPIIKNYINNLKETDKNRVGIMGSSMGGFISSGIFFNDDYFKTLIVFNGSCAWEKLELLSNNNYSNIEGNYKEQLKKYDPTLNLDEINERPILILHGDEDSSLPIENQRYFYNMAKDYYTDLNKIQFIEVPRMNHYISTGMFEKAVAFNEDYLK